MTCRAGAVHGTLTERRSHALTDVTVGAVQHPVTGLGLPASCRLRVLSRSSSGQRSKQSLQGQGSRPQRSSCEPLHAKHGLHTAAGGRFAAGVDRPPPWTNLRRSSPAAPMDLAVAL
jgi:hypothetical protein